jgi:putative two-component system response regulator
MRRGIGLSEPSLDIDKISILAVDDEPLNLDLIEFAFAQEEGVSVMRAVNGREALDLLESHEPSVILLDLAMPVMNGIDTLMALKADKHLETIPVIVITANPGENHRALAAGANDFLVKPVNVEELKLRTYNHAKIKRYHDFLEDSNSILEEKVNEQTQHLRKALNQARDAEWEIAFRLGRAAEFRDRETGAHIWRMSNYCALLADLSGLPGEEVGLILHAAPLHDIGKIGIPDQILQKPGKLTLEEFEHMKRHPVIGGKMLEGGDQYPLIAAGRTIALQHHEKFDGSGYPEGLAGEEIHLYGRIAAVADVFDALSSRRVYKDALDMEKVLAFMAQERGRHFDPRLVDLLLDNLDDFLTIREYMADGPDDLVDNPDMVKG